MPPRSRNFALAFAVFVGAACTWQTPTQSPAPTPLPSESSRIDSAEPSPILLELFTSQGCSSCPPADELLSRIAAESENQVIALSFHVDYWNHIGWRDPYSSAEATRRQRQYAARIAGGRSYTPQLVVNGEAHVVGSNRARVHRALSSASKREPSDVRIDAAVHENALRADELVVDATIFGAIGGSDAVVLVVLYENDLRAKVTRGENAGRTMRNDFVVRELVTLAPGESSARFALDASWQRENLGLVAIAQDPESMAILAAKRVPFAGGR